MVTHRLGQRITELRGTYSLDRETLERRSGVPAGLVARVEDEGFVPDLATLLGIARAFGVRLGTLLDDHVEEGPVVTRAADAGSSFRNGLRFNPLAAGKGGRHMEPFLVDIEPGAVREESAAEGEEFILVISGRVRFEYGNSAETLGPGDSVYYDAVVPHRVSCAEASPARFLVVIHTPL